MLCSYDDLCYIICTLLRGRYCVIQHSCCNTNKTIIKLLTQSELSKVESREEINRHTSITESADEAAETVAATVARVVDQPSWQVRHSQLHITK